VNCRRAIWNTFFGRSEFIDEAVKQAVYRFGPGGALESLFTAMKFTKMQGIGNDYVYVNGFDETVADPARVAREVSDRHFGIGADGLILIMPSRKADVRMRMFNADGSEAEMCGNGVRCVAKYAYDHGLSRKNPMQVETGNGVLSLELHTEGGKVQQVTVNMGEPVLELAKIPVTAKLVSATDEADQYVFEVGGERISHATFVSMGNPHVVIFTENPGAIDLAKLGPAVEHFAGFPNRINAHWVKVNSRSEVTMLTWERGSGITLACGTGACAVCVAGAITGRTDRKILAHLPGGDLTLDWRQADNCVYMTGPAVEVFSGEWPQ
jgi:diaminopimelate epimerase